jgi:thioredoxin-related protein
MTMPRQYPQRVLLQVFALLCLAALPVAGGRADPPPGYHYLRYDEGLRLAKRENKRVFVYFGRYGCGFCDKTNKESFSDAGVRKLYSEHYVLVYVDAESGKRLQLPSGETITEMELGARMKALVTPYFLFLEPDGQLIYKAPGFQTIQSFMEYDRYIHGGHYKTQTLLQYLGK